MKHVISGFKIENYSGIAGDRREISTTPISSLAAVICVRVNLMVDLWNRTLFVSIRTDMLASPKRWIFNTAQLVYK